MPISPYMEEERGEKLQLQTPGFDVGDPLCGQEEGWMYDFLAAGSRVLQPLLHRNQIARGAERMWSG